MIRPTGVPCYNSICMFRKVLIANRGEIAVRVIRTLREMDIASVAVFSDADRARSTSAWRMKRSASGRVRRPKAICVSIGFSKRPQHGAEAIHPGYGFLSENAEFAAACEEAGIVFIGPSADSIRRMGSKTAARRIGQQRRRARRPRYRRSRLRLEQARALRAPDRLSRCS